MRRWRKKGRRRRRRKKSREGEGRERFAGLQLTCSPAHLHSAHLHTASSMSSLTIRMHSPRSSLPRRPALPLICVYSPHSMNLRGREKEGVQEGESESE
jgi:hypothetical protein